MVSSHFSSFIGMLHSSSSPLFPYTTLFRSGRPGTAAGGDHLRAADPAGALDPAAGPRRLTGVGSAPGHRRRRSEEHTSELQSRGHLVCRLLLEKKNINKIR